MQSLLEELMGQMATVDLSKDHSSTMPKAVAEGEEIIGVMSDSLKCLYLVVAESCKKLDADGNRISAALAVMHEKSPDVIPEEARTLSEEYNLAQKRHNQLKHAFWAFLKADFPKADSDSYGVGIRKDWQVVVYPTGRSMEVRIGAPIFLNGGEGLSELFSMLSGTSRGKRNSSRNRPLPNVCEICASRDTCPHVGDPSLDGALSEIFQGMFGPR